MNSNYVDGFMDKCASVGIMRKDAFTLMELGALLGAPAVGASMGADLGNEGDLGYGGRVGSVMGGMGAGMGAGIGAAGAGEGLQGIARGTDMSGRIGALLEKSPKLKAMLAGGKLTMPAVMLAALTAGGGTAYGLSKAMSNPVEQPGMLDRVKAKFGR